MAEVDLYPLVRNYLNLEFAPSLKPQRGVSLPLVAITSNAAGADAGKWSRPDLALVNLWRHKYQPSFTLDLYGFEVKPTETCDLSSVHETLAHTRLVHFSYLVWQLGEDETESRRLQLIRDNCEAYEIGLITFAKVDGLHRFKVHLNCNRRNPSPSVIDEFIETRFGSREKDRLLAWLERQ